MIRPGAPLNRVEEEVCLYVLCGYDNPEIGRRMGVQLNTVRSRLWKIGNKLEGPSWAGPRVRIIMWYSMEIGVRQYLAGLRGDDGKLLAPPPHAGPRVCTFPEPEQLMQA